MYVVIAYYKVPPRWDINPYHIQLLRIEYIILWFNTCENVSLKWLAPATITCNIPTAKGIFLESNSKGRRFVFWCCNIWVQSLLTTSLHVVSDHCELPSLMKLYLTRRYFPLTVHISMDFNGTTEGTVLLNLDKASQSSSKESFLNCGDIWYLEPCCSLFPFLVHIAFTFHLFCVIFRTCIFFQNNHCWKKNFLRGKSSLQSLFVI